ncbi:MAG: hypothetical protein LBH11_02630 [Propionibacteriaceae bacterium]|nr:hypothetical protein [Propionibacteriaceae bacterium]
MADGIDLDKPLPARPAPVGEGPTNGATTRGGFTVTGPITSGSHGTPFAAYYGDISEIGYLEEEYFLSGVAQHYVPIGELTSDGKWTLESGSTAPYTTRILVRRPTDPAKFNGTVIVEWANVSSGFDFPIGDPVGMYQEGFAYVLVTAQPIGITGFAEDPKGLRTWDAERYGTLNIPDEGLSYDVFTQAARAVGPTRAGRGVDPLDGLKVEHLIAYGASQSGSRILAYANGVQPIEATFDALMPTLHAGYASDFYEADAHAVKGGGSRDVQSEVRDDLQVPVLSITTQSEAAFLFSMRQPDSNVYRSWEITGAPHFPSGLMANVANMLTRDGIASSITDLANRPKDVNWQPVLEAAYVRVDEWIRGEAVPPRFPPLQISLLRFTYSTDTYGNANGGLRLPEITVPSATYDVSIFGGLIGSTIPFDHDRLAKLYPTHENYVAEVAAAARQAEKDGILLPFRVQQYIDEATAADIP